MDALSWTTQPIEQATETVQRKAMFFRFLKAQIGKQVAYERLFTPQTFQVFCRTALQQSNTGQRVFQLL
jgi:hypothetical protein